MAGVQLISVRDVADGVADDLGQIHAIVGVQLGDSVAAQGVGVVTSVGFDGAECGGTIERNRHVHWRSARWSTACPHPLHDLAWLPRPQGRDDELSRRAVVPCRHVTCPLNRALFWDGLAPALGASQQDNANHGTERDGGPWSTNTTARQVQATHRPP